MDDAAPIDESTLMAGGSSASAVAASVDDLAWAVVKTRAGDQIVVNEPLISAYQAASSPHSMRA